MPRGDRTGPTGMGPMTGRAAGYCAGYATPGFANPVGGRGFGFGGQGGGGGRGGGGRGRRNMYYATGLTGQERMYPGGGPYAPAGPMQAPQGPAMSRQQELDTLKGQAAYFEDALKNIKDSIEKLQAQSDKV